MNTKKWASALLLAGLTLGLASCNKKQANEEPTPTHVYTITKVEVSPNEVDLGGEVGKTNLEEINFGDAVLGTGKFTQVNLKDNTITFIGDKVGSTRIYEVKNGSIHAPKRGAMPFAPKVGTYEVKEGKISGSLNISMYQIYISSYQTRYGKPLGEELTKVLTALGKAKTESTITFEGTLKK